MDLKSDVYSAASDGKVARLRQLLEALQPPELATVFESRINGSTPLIMGCRNGHFEVVEFLVRRCHADVEQVGSVTFDGETIDGAPPLWCAAAAGYLNVVRFLLKSGAGVNSTTYTNSTPLRAACFDGHHEIVQYLVEKGADLEIANRHGHTCLMISCYKGHHKIVKYLIEKGADVNRKSLKGNTALHDCAESGSLEIMKLLLSCNAQMEKDFYGMTPLLAAAVTGHTRVVEYLISRSECSKVDRVHALELLGATYVDKKRDMLGAWKYWKSAMRERLNDSPVGGEGELGGGEITSRKSSRRSKPVPAYDNSVEIESMEELDNLITDPDEMRMQALLVRERILGPAHPDTSYYIRYRGAVYADMGNIDRCISLWMYALAMQQGVLEPLSPMTQSSFLSFAELFSFVMTEGHSHCRGRPQVAFGDMIVVYEKAVRELEVGMTHLAKTSASSNVSTAERDLTNFNRLLVILMHLLCLLCRLLPNLSSDDEYRLKKTTYRLVKTNPRGLKGFTPLHLACSKETSTVGRYPVCSFPSVEVAALLLEVGASVNAADLERNAPLHVAAANKPTKPEMVRLLLEKGAHLDACNAERRTPIDLLQGVALHDVVSPLAYLSLQCLAAQVIVRSGVEYKGRVPVKLEQFIRLH